MHHPYIVLHSKFPDYSSFRPTCTVKSDKLKKSLKSAFFAKLIILINIHKQIFKFFMQGYNNSHIFLFQIIICTKIKICIFAKTIYQKAFP